MAAAFQKGICTRETIWFPEMSSDDDVFHALADPTRRLILDELSQRGEQTLYELCARLIMKHHVAMTRQGIGKHLSILRRAGLVSAHRAGKYLVLGLDETPIRRISERWLQRLARE